MPGSAHGVLRLGFVTYRGAPLDLPDGTPVRSGDVVGEIHIENRRVAELTVDSPWRILPAFREDLITLAAWTLRPDFPVEAQAFHALSLLGRAGRGLGFSVHPRSASIGRRLEQMYMLGILEIYSHDGARRLERGGTRASFPDDIWMSRKTLVRLYGPGAPRSLSAVNVLTGDAE